MQAVKISFVLILGVALVGCSNPYKEAKRDRAKAESSLREEENRSASLTAENNQLRSILNTLSLTDSFIWVMAGTLEDKSVKDAEKHCENFMSKDDSTKGTYRLPNNAEFAEFSAQILPELQKKEDLKANWFHRSDHEIKYADEDFAVRILKLSFVACIKDRV